MSWKSGHYFYAQHCCREACISRYFHRRLPVRLGRRHSGVSFHHLQRQSANKPPYARRDIASLTNIGWSGGPTEAPLGIGLDVSAICGGAGTVECSFSVSLFHTCGCPKSKLKQTMDTLDSTAQTNDWRMPSKSTGRVTWRQGILRNRSAWRTMYHPC